MELLYEITRIFNWKNLYFVSSAVYRQQLLTFAYRGSFRMMPDAQVGYGASGVCTVVFDFRKFHFFQNVIHFLYFISRPCPLQCIKILEACLGFFVELLKMLKSNRSMIGESGDTTQYAEFIAQSIQLYKIPKWIQMNINEMKVTT